MTDYQKKLTDTIARKEKRKLAIKDKFKIIWSGFGMFGLIGFTIAIPTVVGAFIGRYMDKNSSGKISWTLTGIGLGLLIGCLNAWRYIARETKND